jgi:hypothetical protein
VRIVTIDTSKEKEDRKPLVLLDPEIVWSSEEQHAVEVVDLVLEAGGQQPVGLLLHGLAVEGAEADRPPRSRDRLVIGRDPPLRGGLPVDPRLLCRGDPARPGW